MARHFSMFENLLSLQGFFFFSLGDYISFLNRIRLYSFIVESLGLASDRGVLKDPQLCLAFVWKMSVE